MFTYGPNHRLYLPGDKSGKLTQTNGLNNLHYFLLFVLLLVFLFIVYFCFLLFAFRFSFFVFPLFFYFFIFMFLNVYLKELFSY